MGSEYPKGGGAIFLGHSPLWGGAIFLGYSSPGGGIAVPFKNSILPPPQSICLPPKCPPKFRDLKERFTMESRSKSFIFLRVVEEEQRGVLDIWCTSGLRRVRRDPSITRGGLDTDQ